MKKVGSEKPDEGQRGRDLVEEGVGPHRGVDADGQRDEQAQELGRAEDEQRGRQPLEDQRDHVDAADEGEAPVARSIEVNQRA